MAKPIRATPKLNSSETNDFLEKIMKVNSSRIKIADRKLAREIIKDFSL
jgi:hypothetical protein